MQLCFSSCMFGVSKGHLEDLHWLSACLYKGVCGLATTWCCPRVCNHIGQGPVENSYVGWVYDFFFFLFVYCVFGSVTVLGGPMFNSSSEWGLTQITQYCFTYFSSNLFAIITTVEIMFGPLIPSFLGVSLFSPFLVFPVFVPWWSVVFVLV